MKNGPRYNILVVYHALDYPLRATIYDHLYSFGRYSKHRVVYLNIAVRKVPRYILKAKFDLVIFHTITLGRWFRETFWEILEPTHVLKQIDAPKAILPQDEFLNSDLLVELIREFDVNYVFSVAPPSQWPKIYAGTDFQRVGFHEVLTGYLDPQTLRSVEVMAGSVAARTIDIGYRAYRAEPWLGRFGWIKRRLADEFLQQAPQRGLRVDISTDQSATLLGMDWYRFLLACKYTIGVEGGSSILDRDGTIKLCSERYLRQHPQATFEEVERDCFPGLDGNLQLAALSPRHLEACATRTCQILVEGDYNGVLRPNEHYLPLRGDFSNLDEVLDAVERDAVRPTMIEFAYRDVVASGRYTYQQFVDQVVGPTLGARPAMERGDSDGDELCRRAARDDRRSWNKVRLVSAASKLLPRRFRGSHKIVRIDRKILRR